MLESVNSTLRAGSVLIRNSLRRLCVLCVSAVSALKPLFTAETQRSQRLRREELRLGHYLKSGCPDLRFAFSRSGKNDPRNHTNRVEQAISGSCILVDRFTWRTEVFKPGHHSKSMNWKATLRLPLLPRPKVPNPVFQKMKWNVFSLSARSSQFFDHAHGAVGIKAMHHDRG